MLKAFTSHPASVGESYAEHLGFAWRFGFDMVRGGLACFVHGLFPFACKTRGSRTVLDLHARLLAARRRQAAMKLAERLRAEREPEFQI